MAEESNQATVEFYDSSDHAGQMQFVTVNLYAFYFWWLTVCIYSYASIDNIPIDLVVLFLLSICIYFMLFILSGVFRFKLILMTVLQAITWYLTVDYAIHMCDQFRTNIAGKPFNGAFLLNICIFWACTLFIVLHSLWFVKLAHDYSNCIVYEMNQEKRRVRQSAVAVV